MRRLLTWKSLGRIALAALALTVASPLLFTAVSRYLGGREYDSIVAELDATDPGWRLADLIREHNAGLPPDNRNPLIVAVAADNRLPAGFVSGNRNREAWRQKPRDEPLPVEVVAAMRAAMAGTRPAFDLAMTLADMGEGGAAADPNPAVARGTILLPLIRVSQLLSAEAILRADAEDAEVAFRATRAVLALSRCVSGGPIAGGGLSRSYFSTHAIDVATRVVNQGATGDGLAALQAELLAEAARPKRLDAARAERALTDPTMSLLAAGGMDTKFVGGKAGRQLYMPYAAGDHAACLRLLTAFVAAAKLLPAERAAAVTAIELPADDDPRFHVTRMMARSLNHIWSRIGQSDARLIAAAAALACERHRLRFGEWPASLDAIPKDILAEVPVSPEDGRPLVYTRSNGGIEVRCDLPPSNRLGRPDPAHANGGSVSAHLIDPARRPHAK